MGLRPQDEHYKSKSGVDVIDFCAAYSLGFSEGNIIKYIARAGKKQNNTKLDDLYKAKNYLERLIEKELKEGGYNCFRAGQIDLDDLVMTTEVSNPENCDVDLIEEAEMYSNETYYELPEKISKEDFKKCLIEFTDLIIKKL